MGKVSEHSPKHIFRLIPMFVSIALILTDILLDCDHI
jgi:hypothetical protein